MNRLGGQIPTFVAISHRFYDWTLPQQGEGAPTLRKGTCARHLHDVKGLLKGVHVTVNARNEEEVEEEQVLAAVAKSTSTSYNFSDRSEHSERTKPVVSTTQLLFS